MSVPDRRIRHASTGHRTAIAYEDRRDGAGRWEGWYLHSLHRCLRPPYPISVPGIAQHARRIAPNSMSVPDIA
eukprot:813256-Rhodomonas_salina.1